MILAFEKSIASRRNSRLVSDMAEAKKFGFESPHPMLNDEDQDTLDAIDEGIRDAEAGRTVAAEEVLKLLPKWTTGSATRKNR
jgi:predicted transcriptional regulator